MTAQVQETSQTDQDTPLFLRAAKGENTSRAPIWIMRQAGRYLPEYRALKEKYTFLQLAGTPELAAEVTLQPLRRFPLDASIVFADIMTPLESMGVQIDFSPGPVIANPIRNVAAVEALRVPEPEEITPFVMETIRILRKELKVPLIGFGGAPLTLATYLVQGQGSKEYEFLRQFLRAEPKAAHALLDKLADLSIGYLREQVKAGAQTIQLFDSWAGIHDAQMYREFGAKYATKVLEGLADCGVPRIYIAVGSSHLYSEIAALPAEVISVDWRMPLNDIRPHFPGKVLQGNLDPAVLLSNPETITAQATKVLQAGLGGPHIFNLGHGIFKQTPPEHVAHLIECVQQFERS